MKIEFVTYDFSFLQASTQWLSDSEIRFLTATPMISQETQEKWFASLTTKKDYYIKGILADGKPIGACGLKHITEVDGEYWGYIGEKNYWRKGIGKQMMAFIEKYARSLKLKQIYLKVIPENIRAIQLYTKQGYVEDENNSEIIKMCKQL